MLASLLLALAAAHPWLAAFAFPSVILIAAVVTLAILSAVLTPDRDNRITLE